MTSQAELADRYGAPSRRRRALVVAAVAVLAVAGLAWLAWAAWFHGTPEAESAVAGYDVQGDHTVQVTIEVRLDGVDEADCLVRALAEDKAVVGELPFVGVEGRQELTVRTERRATSVESVGCTTPGQSRRR